MNCRCKPVLYLDGQAVKVLRIDFCPQHAQVDDLLKALAQALETIEALRQGAFSSDRLETPYERAGPHQHPV
jgi:hypothetical protein